MADAQSQKSVIRTIILRRVTLASDDDTSDATAQLDTIVGSSDLRDLFYQCCADIMEEDSKKRHGICTLLLEYVAGFPPSRYELEALRTMCIIFSKESPKIDGVLDELLDAVETYLRRRPLDRSPTISLPLPRRVVSFGSSDVVSDRVSYTRVFGLQPLLGDVGSGAPFISIPQWQRREVWRVAEEKNADVSPSLTLRSHCGVLSCRDYINQAPLLCTAAVLEKHIGTLNSYHQHYRTNPEVIRATMLLTKVMCDGYVEKIPLRSGYTFFRSVSICFLPTYFAMMESEYVSVRNHVYSMILTLGLHFQLVDTQNVYPGCTQALEEELVWLLQNIVHKQVCLELVDDMTWKAAAKCVAAVVPPAHMHRIDVRALSRFMRIPEVAALHPHVFSMFSKVFSGKLLCGSEREGTRGRIQLNPVEFGLLGSTAVSEVLQLYRLSMTPAARTSLFRVVVAVAVGSMRDEITPISTFESALATLEDLECPWFLHGLLFYQSYKTLRELPTQITHDLDRIEERDVKTAAAKIVKRIVHLIEEESRLPEIIIRSYRTACEVRGGSRAEALAKLGEDAVAVVPQMLLDDEDGTLHQLGWRMLLNCFRILSEYLPPERSKPITRRLIDNVVSFNGGSGTASLTKVRAVCADVLTSLAMLSGTQPTQAVEVFEKTLDAFLASCTVSDEPAMMHLVTRIIGLMAVKTSTQCEAVHEDVTHMCLHGTLKISAAAAESFGARMLWALYRNLRTTDAEVGCRARFLLISTLSVLDVPNSSAQLRAWATALSDPHAPSALVAAQKVVRLCRGFGHESAIGTATDSAFSSASGTIYSLAVGVIEALYGKSAPSRI